MSSSDPLAGDRQTESGLVLRRTTHCQSDAIIEYPDVQLVLDPLRAEDNGATPARGASPWRIAFSEPTADRVPRRHLQHNP
jgi:hypothetical protein